MIYKDFATMLPLQKGDKKPVGKWKDSNRKEVIDFNSSDFLNRDVGLCPLPGYIAIDVDVKERKDGLASLELLGLSIGETLTQQTPSGGYHLIYKINPNIELKSTVSTLDGIDLRTANQGYIKLYNEWLDYEEDEITTDAIIELPSSAIKMLLDAQKEAHKSSEIIEAGGIIEEGNRNATFASIAGKLWKQGLDIEAIRSEMHNINLTRCDAPMACDEVDSIVNSITRYTRDEKVDTTCVDTLIGTLLSNDIAKEEEDKKISAAAMQRMPKECFNVTGILKEVFNDINTMSFYETPHLSLATAISLVGGIASKKYRNPMDGKTNIFVVGVAKSGLGKDTGRKYIKKTLLAREQGIDYLGEEVFKSGAGVLAAVTDGKNKIYPIDEMGLYLQASIGERADPSKKDIIPNFLKLYSTDEWTGSAAASKENSTGIIRDINLTVYGTSTPEEYYPTVTKQQVNSGFIPRFIIIDDAIDHTNYVKNKNRQKFDPCWKSVESIYNLIDHTKHIRSDELKTYIDTVTQVDFKDKLAVAAHDQIDDSIESIKRTSDLHMVLWNRAYENTMKLATIYAISEDYVKPKITSDGIKWASSLVTYCLNSVEKRLAGTSKSKYGEDLEEIYSVIKSSKRGITLTNLSTECKTVDRVLRNKIIEDLVDMEKIYFVNIKTKGAKKPTKIFYAV